MNIIHYSLGISMFRKGGLVKYTTDLMNSQSEIGHSVALLYPGDSKFIVRNCKIQNRKSINRVAIYELVNTLPVSILHGVAQPKDFLYSEISLSSEELEKLYVSFRPQIMHIHTLMGLPLKVIEYFKNKGVKIVFTTHDYFGLCLKVNFINYLGECCDIRSSLECARCNQNSPSTLFLRIRNSSFLLKRKDHLLKLSRYFSNHTFSFYQYINPSSRKVSDYELLLKQYLNCFNLMDLFHFNSSLSRDVFNKYLSVKNHKVLSITHSGILDNRKIKNLTNSHLKFGFIFGSRSQEGYDLLSSVLDDLKRVNINNWTLYVWGETNKNFIECANIYYRGVYSSANMDSVYNSIDLLIVPSAWMETFSFVSLEALSFGTPVLVSNNVGAKDIINEICSNFVFGYSKEELFFKLKSILFNPELLNNFNRSLNKAKFDHLMDDHVYKIIKMYKSI